MANHPPLPKSIATSDQQYKELCSLWAENQVIEPLRKLLIGMLDRIDALEKGPQNKPFILPKRLGPGVEDRPL